MGEPPFFKLERKTQCFFTVQISSKVRFRFVCGPIDLKFGGEVCDSLIFNLNNGDWIWSSERSSFSLRTVVVFDDISPLSLCKVVEIAKINLS